jgi:hypothetical protein
MLFTRRGALGGGVRFGALSAFALAAPVALLGAAMDDATAPVVPPSIAAEVRAVIEAQLAAFAVDDAQRAFSFAAPSIRTLFGDADRFIAMVRTQYPVVYRPLSVSFLAPVQQDDDLLQAVRMSDADGAVWLALYLVQRQQDGAWRIGGCELQRLGGRST